MCSLWLIQYHDFSPSHCSSLLTESLPRVCYTPFVLSRASLKQNLAHVHQISLPPLSSMLLTAQVHGL